LSCDPVVWQEESFPASRQRSMSTDPDGGSRSRPPINIDTAMLLLSFTALAIGCIILAIDLFSRRLPMGPPV
jgi:hypothetical protein